MEAATRPRLSLTFTSVPFRLRVEAAGLFTYTALTCFLMQNGIKLKKTAEEEDGMISNKKPRKATLAKDKLYGCFVKVIVCCLSAACPFLLYLLQFSHHTACHSLLVTGVTR